MFTFVNFFSHFEVLLNTYFELSVSVSDTLPSGKLHISINQHSKLVSTIIMQHKLHVVRIRIRIKSSFVGYYKIVLYDKKSGFESVAQKKLEYQLSIRWPALH